ncbi:hypothetical protein ACSBR1_035941 [Camellia fascicularis]
MVLEGSVVPTGEFAKDRVRDHRPNHQHFGMIQGIFAALVQGGTLSGDERVCEATIEEVKKAISAKSVSGKAMSGECYFSAMEVLEKHDEKYMSVEIYTERLITWLFGVNYCTEWSSIHMSSRMSSRLTSHVTTYYFFLHRLNDELFA